MAKTRKMLAAPLNLLSEHFAPTTDVGRKKLRKQLANAEAQIEMLAGQNEQLRNELQSKAAQIAQQQFDLSAKQKALDEALAQLAEKKE